MRAKLRNSAFSAAFASVLLAACCLQVAAQDARPPNIILLIGDDIGYPYLGFMGNEHVLTPATDALAAGGVTFSHGHVTAPYCRPSLRTLVTGLHPVQYQLRLNAHVEEQAAQWFAVDEREQAMRLVLAKARGMATFDTLPKLLAAQGYASWQGGKWWEGSYRNGHFDEGMTESWDMSLYGTDGFFAELMGGKGNRLVRETMEPLFDFIDRKADQPLFIWFGPMLPHTPLDAPYTYAKYYRDKDISESAKLYYANLTWWDDGVSRLMDYVEAKGLMEQTLFVFIGDNGWEQDANVEYKKADSTYRTDSEFATGGFRGKGALYDLSVRTPIIFHWRGRLAPSFNQSSLVSSMDLAPTILDFAGAAIPPDLPGQSLRPLLEGTAPIDERQALIGYSDNRRDPDSMMGSPAEGYYVRTHRWHFLWYADTDEMVLYDVTVDPRGDADLSGERPDLVERFQGMIADWQRAVGLTGGRLPIYE